jgi:hypothetical protein
MTMVTLDRDNATTEDLFEVIATLIARLERAEEIICALAGARLADQGHIAAPSDAVSEELTSQLVEYVVVIDQARRNAQADAAFLNARE